MNSLRNGLTVSVLVGLLSVWLAVPAQAATLSYSSSTFAESWMNDGGIGNTFTLTLTNDAFTGVNGDAFGTNKVVASNVPTGLTAVVTRLATNQAQVALVGNAAQHASANSISNFCLAFQDAAFAGGSAAAVTNSVKTNLVVAFLSQNTSNWYVSVSSGSDATGNGSSGNPWATLSNAVAKAQSAANDVIHLAAGTYVASNLAVAKAVTILGNSRDDTFIQPPATNAGILVPTASCKLSNLTLRNGKRNMGGAVYLSNYGIDLYVVNCRLLNNTATNGNGAAIYAAYNGGNVTVSLAGTELSGNQASANGGAAYIYGHGLTASNCVLTGNTASNGGAFYVGGSGPTVTVLDTLAISNSATSGSGGVLWEYSGRLLGVQRSVFANNTAGVDGGAMYLYNLTAASLTNVTFYGNACGQLGGAGQGGAVWNLSSYALSAYDTTFFRNSAPTGGAIRSYGPAKLYGSIVASNTASTGVGPDIYMASGSLVATNSLVSNKGGSVGTDSSLALGQPNAAGCYVGTNGAVLNSGLMSLSCNGGTLPTCALQTNSLAIDHGLNVSGLPWDGRGTGFPRTVGSRSDMGAYELETLAYGSRTFYEAAANDGSISNSIVVTLGGATFNASVGDNLVSLGKVQSGNMPTGLVAVVTVNSATQATVALTGNALHNTTTDSVSNVSLVFLDSAFSNGYASTVAGYSNATLAVSFFGAAVVRTLSYAGSNFTESVANNGAISNALAVTLSGDTFVGTVGENLATSGKVTAGNVPFGLTLVATLSNASQVILTLSGAASANDSANNVTNLAVTFLDGAFFGGNATQVTGYAQSALAVSFIDPALAYGSDTFIESAANDGSVSNTLAVALVGDTFNATNSENLAASGKVVAVNVPAGLTAVVTALSPTQAVVSLAGNAVQQNSPNNVGNVGFAFQDSAFSHGWASLVANSSRSDLKANYRNPALAYGGMVFNEMPLYPGVITNTLSITLAGDTLAGTAGENFVGSGKVSVGNVPAGLTAVATLTASGTVTLALAGSATANESSNSVGNLSVAFQNGAFACGNAGIVTNAVVNNLSVTFLSASNWYVSTTGSDTTGNGSSNSPFATVVKALSVAQSGANDVIHLLPGIYTQNRITVGKIVTITGNSSTDTILQATAAPFSTNANIITFNQVGYLRNLTLRNGGAVGYGGAVNLGGYNFWAEGCAFASNSATLGGGAVGSSVSGVAGYSFVNCRFAGNLAATDGGGIRVFSPTIVISNCFFAGNKSGGNGGALAHVSGGGGGVTVYGSLLMGNATTNAGGGVYGANGAACTIWCSTLCGNRAGTAGGGLSCGANNGATNLVCNSTFYGNSAGGSGGGIYHWSNMGTPLWVYNSTVYANSAVTNGGGIHMDLSHPYNLVSSIVAGNTATNGPDIYETGAAGMLTNNLIGDGSGAGYNVVAGAPNDTGSYVGTSGAPIVPGLLPPADNGGPCPTCALTWNSVAWNHGANPLGLVWDQRGSPHLRVRFNVPDIGAFEYGPKGPIFGAQ